VTGSEHHEIIAAVNREFEILRHVYVASPEAGADSIDAALGSALNDAEGRVLAVLHAYDPLQPPVIGSSRHREAPYGRIERQPLRFVPLLPMTSRWKQ
jgi:hypothetical protein